MNEELENDNYKLALTNAAEIMIQVWAAMDPADLNAQFANYGDSAIQYSEYSFELAHLIENQEITVKAQGELAQQLIRQTDIQGPSDPSDVLPAPPVPAVLMSPTENYKPVNDLLGGELRPVEDAALRQAALDGPDVLVAFEGGDPFVDPTIPRDMEAPYWTDAANAVLAPKNAAFDAAIAARDDLESTSYQTPRWARSYPQFMAEMQATGYVGPWGEQALLSAYNKTAAAPTPQPTSSPQPTAVLTPQATAAPTNNQVSGSGAILAKATAACGARVEHPTPTNWWVD